MHGAVLVEALDEEVGVGATGDGRAVVAVAGVTIFVIAGEAAAV